MWSFNSPRYIVSKLNPMSLIQSFFFFSPLRTVVRVLRLIEPIKRQQRYRDSAINRPQIQPSLLSKRPMAFSTVIFSSSNLYFPQKRLNLHTQKQSFRCCSSSSSSSISTPKQTQFDLKRYWTTLISEINHELNEAIPVKYPEEIYESMRYSVLAKGAKRAPPVMCIASSEIFGIPRRAAFPTACALEMVHAASLIHDDLPCMDDDISRRGRPTNHAIFGVDMAILAGDALFPLGFEHIVTNTPSDLVPESRILSVIAEFARAVGSTGMAAGQFLDLTNGGEKNLVEFVQEKKFGEMAECSAACGGLLAGAEDEEIEMLRRYGRAVGVLYQVVDDVREAAKMARNDGDEEEEEEEEEEMKKRRRGKSSYVGVYGVERALEMVEELRVKAKRELDGFEKKYGRDRVAPLYSFVDYAVDRGFVVVDDDDEIIAVDRMVAAAAAL